MRNIALIGCSSRKLGKGTAAKYYAKDIYVGSNFKKSVGEGIKKLSCEPEYYILSGKYGLLKMDEEISYYDCYLGSMPVSYKTCWASKVVDQIKKEFCNNINDINFIFFAGNDYSVYVKGYLPHYTTLKFNGRHITFEIKETK